MWLRFSLYSRMLDSFVERGEWTCTFSCVSSSSQISKVWRLGIFPTPPPPSPLQPIHSKACGDNLDFFSNSKVTAKTRPLQSQSRLSTISPLAELSCNVAWVGHYEMEDGTINVMLTEMQHRKTCMDMMAIHRSPNKTVPSNPLYTLQSGGSLWNSSMLRSHPRLK